MPLYDVHWTPAVVLQKGQSIRVGLPDGRTGPLAGLTNEIARNLNLYDVAYVHVSGRTAVRPKVARSGRAKAAFRRDFEYDRRCRERPLCWKTQPGAILAMAGSFSYPFSQLNRTWQTERQPGSTIKPATYLTALQKGLQPNTLVRDEPMTLPPIGAAHRGTTRQEIFTQSAQRRSSLFRLAHPAART